MKLALLIIVFFVYGCSSENTDTPKVKRYPQSLEDIQNIIDGVGSGAVVELQPNKLYEIDNSINLRDFSNVQLIGNNATIKRSDSSNISTYLISNYEGGKVIHVEDNKFKVGDKIMLASGKSIKQVTLDAREITHIEDDKITVNSGFSGDFEKGHNVFKSYPLITGLPSHVENGTNKGIVIDGVNFDGNARNNNTNYGWVANGTIMLHGGKDSVIRNCTFTDIPNETIVGHGILIHDNVFQDLNGSAFHTSVHDLTVNINGYSEFVNNTVINPNRISKGLNGHSEGAISFSWGAGNLLVKNNYFESYSGNYGVLGFFGGSITHPDINLTVKNNTAHNFEYIMKIFLPTENIHVTENTFSNSGFNDFSHVKNENSIVIENNDLLNGTEIKL